MKKILSILIQVISIICAILTVHSMIGGCIILVKGHEANAEVIKCIRKGSAMMQFTDYRGVRQTIPVVRSGFPFRGKCYVGEKFRIKYIVENEAKALVYEFFHIIKCFFVAALGLLMSILLFLTFHIGKGAAIPRKSRN